MKEVIIQGLRQAYSNLVHMFAEFLPRLLVMLVIVLVGLVVAYLNTPAAGHPCSVRNATIRDAAGRLMWCNPTMAASHDTVWQYAPGS